LLINIIKFSGPLFEVNSNRRANECFGINKEYEVKLLRKMKFELSVLVISCFAGEVHAKAVGAGLKTLTDSIRDEIGLASVVLAITMAGLFIAFGKKEGNEKLGSAVTGALVIAFATSIGGIIWSASR
jgi:type IV secretory pathway VirB2 component (pilin)